MPAAACWLHPAAAAELHGQRPARQPLAAARAGRRRSPPSARTRAGTGRARRRACRRRPAAPGRAGAAPRASPRRPRRGPCGRRSSWRSVSGGSASRSHAGRRSTRAGCPVSRRVGLDVEDEAVGGARRPELAVALRRRRVVRGVDLDDRELLGVVPQPRLGAAHARRVEAPAGDERGVGPRTAAHEDACAHRRPPRRRTALFHRASNVVPPAGPGLYSGAEKLSRRHGLCRPQPRERWGTEGGAADGRDRSTLDPPIVMSGGGAALAAPSLLGSSRPRGAGLALKFARDVPILCFPQCRNGGIGRRARLRA